jgi:hypothetical protein
MHLHVVRPDTPGQDPPRHRRGIPAASLSLTAEEARHLRASIRNVARARYGTLAALARALGVHPGVLTRQRRQTPALAVALWRLTAVPVEVLLSGKLAAVPAPQPEAAPTGGAS